MNKKTLIILAQGFEEIEATSIIDILRRAGVSVVVAGLDSNMIKGAHNIKIETDCELSEIDVKYYNSIVIPGGGLGVENLKKSELVCDIINIIYRNEGVVAAICAAPTVLYKAGVLAGKKITAYPTLKNDFKNALYTENMIEVDGRIITGQSVCCSIEFALIVAEKLGAKINTLKKEILFN